MKHRRLLLVAVLAGLAAGTLATAKPNKIEVEHPYMLWSRKEAADMRARIMEQPWARDRFVARFVANSNSTRRSMMDNILLYTMVGDEGAAEAEMQALLGFINAPPLIKDMTDWRWHHVDHTDMALRYDVFYELLTEGQRRALLETFRAMAIFGVEGERIRGFGSVRMLSHLFAGLATGERRIIKALFSCPGGVKQSIDAMVGKNMRRPGYRTVGMMMLWCRAARRAGLDEFGFGYVSPKGGSMRNYLKTYFDCLDPVILREDGSIFLGRCVEGITDLHYAGAGFPMPPLYQRIFAGTLVPGGSEACAGWGDWWGVNRGGMSLYTAKAYNEFSTGAYRVTPPLVFELAHQEWPEDGYDFFLAMSRPKGTDTYYPSLYWGLDPIQADKVTVPDLRSQMRTGRAYALLRSEEGRTSVFSPAPYAVFALPRSRRPADQFDLTSFEAFNRPLYRPLVGGAVSRSRHEYWWKTGKANSLLVVDNRPPRRAPSSRLRHAFDPLVKFVSARAGRVDPAPDAAAAPDGAEPPPVPRVYPGVDMERSLFLTREYLFDVFAVESEKPHNYDWLIQAIGSPAPGTTDGWEPTKALGETMGHAQHLGMPYNFSEQRRLDPGAENWTLNVLQCPRFGSPTNSNPWYGRMIGVRISMLGEPGTQAYFARPPRRRNLTKDEQRQKELIDNPYRLLQRDENYNQADHVVTELQLLPMDAAPAPAPKEPEVKKFKPVGVEAPSKENPTGDLTVVAERRDTKTTVFVALHEPYEKATWYLDRFERLAQTDEALAVRIGSRSGAPTHVDDRVLLRFGPADPAQPVTLEGGGESFTFAGHGYVRITADAVKVAGDVRALKVRVTGEPKLVINGKNTPARIKDGVLHFGA